MLNFKDFINKKIENQEIKNMPEKDISNAQEVINKYSNMSEGELNSKLSDVVKEQKQKNAFDKNSILKEINNLGSFITPEQKTKMEQMLNEMDKKTN